MKSTKILGAIASLVLLFLSSCNNREEITILSNLEYGSYSQGGETQKLLLDLYLPQTQSTQPRSLLIYIHGGGWRQGSKEDCPGEMVAQRGYAMACINYRLSDVAPFPAQIHDAKQAVRWLRDRAAEYNLDSNRFGAWGDSAGGHLSALLGTSAGVAALEGNATGSETSSQVQAVCVWYAPTDFTQVPPAFEEPISQDAIEQYKNAPWFIYTLATHQLLGGPVSQHLDLAAQANPIAYIDPQDPPFLIVHGEQDTVVPIAQSELLVEALQKKGVDATFIRDANLGHSYAGSRGEPFDPKLVDRALKFFQRHFQEV